MSFEAAVKQIMKKNEKMIIVSGTVKTVRDFDCDVSRDEDQPDLLGVRFNSVLTAVEHQFKITPKKGSKVLCGIIEGDVAEAVILSYGDIDKVTVTIDNLVFEIVPEGVKITNNGKNLKTVLNTFQDKFGELCDALTAVQVTQGVPPNVTVINTIKQSVVTTNKADLNNILIS